ncbi:hypothetical protein [Haloechinothrix sp. LS1_15]|uniref:hypothetical protein n=1 Tax=Haloechinothrix sp. LS1_15 TaxID=2652248 RepID=UPI0029447821|nr:hypothetical protein [Haloechinothrix sp. LS1_15]MDV6012447.1 hypothetical protein [Haloechinothrix sp. LS1_15]
MTTTNDSLPHETQDDTDATLPLTAEKCLAILTEWAARYPSARFVVITIAPDGSDAAVLGWGLALPEYVFVNLPEMRMTGRFRTADELRRLLRHSDDDIRLIWVDPEPEPWPDEET